MAIARTAYREELQNLEDQALGGIDLASHALHRTLEAIAARGVTLVVVEHDMHFIRMIAGTVTVLHQGRVLIEDDVGRVLSDPTVRDVYLGREAGSAPACSTPKAAALAS